MFILSKLFEKTVYKIALRKLEVQVLTEEKFLFECVKNQNSAPINKKPVRNESSYETYSDLHSEKRTNRKGYINNNWGELLLKYDIFSKSKNLFEVGAGNGKFLLDLRKRGFNVRGIDLVNPNHLDEIITGDITELNKDDILSGALIYSADFLEHLPERVLHEYFEATKDFEQFHMIACYDDGVSHESVYAPHEWAYIFNKHFREVEILDVIYRRPYFRKKAVVLRVAN